MRVFVVLLLWAFLTAPVSAAVLVLDKVDTNAKIIALTVEEVVTTQKLEQILDICKKEDIHLTVFSASSFITDNIEIIKRAQAMGIEFGVSGTKRQSWEALSYEDIIKDIEQADAALSNAIGSSARLVRPPFGYYNNKLIRVMEEEDRRYILVRGISTGDWPVTNAQYIADKVVSSLSNGGIININLYKQSSLDALPMVIQQAKANGYRFLTVSEMISSVKPPKEEVVKNQRYFEVISRVDNPHKPAISLTFDDSGSYYQVTKLLSVLKKNFITGTFFVSGEWALQSPELVRAIAADGHEIANHSYSHAVFTRLDNREIEIEIKKTEQAIIEATGKPPVKYFRPPYGDYNDRVSKVLENIGYEAVVLWDVDTMDWSGVSAAEIITNVEKNALKGSIILFHIHGKNTAEALDTIIPDLKSKGYLLTNLSDLRI
ncbi:polysaccharide deacetylase family protein [Dendrosporobacter sp. 1207_IL3150]|uniref:polysaccharide deacetylase family protein n=1 Tax=Dendrosporobacter sp. 1207_IL3150 TaxID=3084054 RepID=UPI002FDA20BB